MIWKCPNCQSLLKPKAATPQVMVCAQGHTFDRAKEGYLNLLLANEKKSKIPGDAPEMMQARQNFLNRGYYQPLVAQLLDLIQKLRPKGNTHLNWLDMGCGEGYYLESIAKKLHEASIYGVDISKVAISKAAKRFQKLGDLDQRNVQFEAAVSSSYKLPILDQTIDFATLVFAPMCETEILRVLKPSGVFLRVTPGPAHLFQLKQMIYKTPEYHEPPKALETLAPLTKEQFTFTLDIPSQVLLNELLPMTPYQWHGDHQFLKSEIQNVDAFPIMFDFVIETFRNDSV